MISICILNYGEPTLTFQAVKSVLRQEILKTIPYEVLILDNYSSDANYMDCLQISERYRSFGYNVDVISLDNKHRFITGLNGAFKHAKHDWVLFMENDIVMKQSCLYRLLCGRDINEITSPSVFSPEGKLERYGSKWIWPGYGINQKKWEPYSDLMTPSCFLMHKAAFDEIGKFDADFAPAYYEDVDYSIRARKLGYHFRVVREASVFHRHNSTFGSVYNKSIISGFCELNRNRVIRKHYYGFDRRVRLNAIKILNFIHERLPLSNGKNGNRNN